MEAESGRPMNFYMCLSGTQRLEELFCLIRTMTSDSNCTDVQLAERADLAALVAKIYTRHPEWALHTTTATWLANANNVAEQAAAAKALKAGDKAAASVMAAQEQHGADYDPDEDEDNTSQSSSSSSISSSQSSDNSSSSNNSNSSSSSSKQSSSSSTTQAEKRKKKQIPKKKKHTKAKSPVKQQAPGNTGQKRPAASQGGKPKKR